MKATALLPEFDLEMANTRKALERIPGDRLGYKPHDKSFSLLQLAGHLSNIPAWTSVTLTTDGLDVSQPFDREAPTDVAGVLAEFDANVAEARAVLEAADEAQLMAPWTLRNGDEVMFTMPRASTFRMWVMNHTIHHRAQLTVYLRLLDVPVPALYGPSADEA